MYLACVGYKLNSIVQYCFKVALHSREKHRISPFCRITLNSSERNFSTCACW